MAATMRSLTSPDIAPLYWPTQARSDCSASRSACAIAPAVSAGLWSPGGRIGTVAAVFGVLAAVEGAVGCARSGGPKSKATNINVAVSIGLMTNARVDCGVGNYGPLL